ncbi:MAG: PAS domain S-box protein [Pyrinomonadaceae bacterium]|nr:PAS domain S-box protein [Pyrinomonadaceae bacterium]
MKTLFSRLTSNRSPLLPLCAALLLTGAVFAWIIGHFFGSSNVYASAVNEHSAAPAVIITFILSFVMAAMTVTAGIFHKSQKVLLMKTAEMERAEECLRESEARYRIVIESASDAIITIDHDHTILFVNSAAQKIFGYAVDEMMGNKLFMLMPKRMRAAHAAGMKRYDQTNERSIFWQGTEFPGLHKDGSEILLEVSFGENNSGGKHLITAVIRDITERRQTEEKLRESREWLQAIFDVSRDGIVIEDGEKVVYINKSYTRLLGYDYPEELIGRQISELLSAEDAQRMAEYGRRRLRGESAPSVYEYKCKLKDGKLLSAEGAVTTAVIGGKKYIMTASRDIAERKQAEKILQKNLSLLTSTFEATADGILVVDRDNRVVTFNQRFVDIVGMPEECISSRDNGEFINFVLDQLVDPKKFVEKTQELTSHPELKSYDDIEFKDGRIYERYSHPHVLDGEIIGRVVSFRDVSERKRAETAVRQSEEKYRTILETIEEGYYEVNLQGNFTFFNRALVESLRFDEKEIRGLNFRRYVDGKTARRLAGVYREVFRTGQPANNLEYEIIREDGTRMCAESSVTLVCDENKQPVGFRGVVRDVTARKQSEVKLRRSESMLAAAQRITHLGSWELEINSFVDASKNRVQWSDEVYRIFGYEPQQFEVFGDIFYSFSHPDDRTRITRALFRAIKKRTALKIEARITLPNGEERLVQAEAEVIYDQKTAQPSKFVGTVQDITDRQRANAALRESENNFRTLLESMHEGLVRVSNNEVIEFVNDRFCEMTGFTREELLGKTTFEMLFDEEGGKTLVEANRQRQAGISGEYELSLRKKSGETFWALVGGAPIINAEGIVTGTIGVFTDITTRKRAEEQLLYDAFHDGLTGLANRALFMDHLRMTIERGKSRHSNSYAVLFLDFDRFKVINDSLGHAEGDRLLNLIARRLESATRTGDLVARLGGDEFVILLSEMPAENDAVLIAERIQNYLKDAFDLNGSEVIISASIGIALSNAGHKRAEDMVRDADIAMYRAKAKGKAQYQIFDQAMHENAANQLRLETEMRQALERREFQLYYQPIIKLETETLIGFEALVRWRHPTRGIIPPLEFIGAAEENRLILPLGNWILRESCRQMRYWQDVYPAALQLTVSVNLSCKQFLQPDLAEQIAATLAATELDPRCLKLEITESYIMENSEMAVTIMNRLRALGVEISLDDFGTGYSSLSYLHRLPVDYLKIDRSFVSRMTDSRENSEIVSTVIKLAQNLKMKVIAEGIETADQLAHLKQLHCEYGQGYFFSKPLEANAAEMFIEEKANDFSLTINQDCGLELNM